MTNKKVGKEDLILKERKVILTNYLNEINEKYKFLKNSINELEIAWGTFNRENFSPGVSKEKYEELLSLLQNGKNFKDISGGYQEQEIS